MICVFDSDLVDVCSVVYFSDISGVSCPAIDGKASR